MFVGMDLHKIYLQIAVMNEKGKVLENSKIDNNLKQVGEFFDNLNNEKTRIAMYRQHSVRRPSHCLTLARIGVR